MASHSCNGRQAAFTRMGAYDQVAGQWVFKRILKKWQETKKRANQLRLTLLSDRECT